jgi:DNA-binding CsgD family transcriptional regulator
VLIGRESEMATLARHVAQVARQTGSTLLIEGEPGIGKSTLVRTALALATVTGGGCQIFWGAGDELGQALPLVPMLEALRVREPSADPRRKAILALLRGEVAAEGDPDVPVTVAEQLLALVTEQCAQGPVILVIDDLQWADQASVALWARLARLVQRLPLLLIGTMRPVPQRDDLVALRRAAGDMQRLQLTGLTETAAAALVAALVGGRPDDDLLKLASGAAGNPLYITELIGALARTAGVIITESGTAELAGGSAPESLSAAIADRLGFVSGPVREVLRAAALLGVEFSVPDLAIVLHRSVADLIPPVDQAIAAGVLAESGTVMGFRHPLIRAALYDAIPLPVRAAWHREAARSLAEAGAPAGRVARQLLGAGGGDNVTAEPMDEWTLTWLTRTADLLVWQAPRVAADLLGHAVASVPAGSAQYEALVGRLADTLYRVGDMASAEHVASRALAHISDPGLRIDLLWTVTQCRMWTGPAKESLGTLYEALSAPALPARHRARLLVMAARTHCALGEVEKAGRAAEQALESATEAADNGAMGWALHVLTIATAVQGQTVDALPLFDRALAVTEGDPSLTDLRLLLQINKVITLGNLDRYEEAIVAAKQAHQLADRVGSVLRLAQVSMALCELLWDTGQWDDAMVQVRARPPEQKEPGAACCELGIAAVICFHRGDVAAAREYLAAAAPHAQRIGNRLIGPLALARSLDREYAGALDEALAELTGGFVGDTEELEEIEDLLADAVRLAATIGDETAAASMATFAANFAAGSQIPHRQANALYCRGLVSHDAALLLSAAQCYAGASRPLLRAKALETAAIEFVRSGDQKQARAAFNGALEAYSALGAAADADRLQAAFRAHGIRRGPRAKHRQADSGWDSLTPAETKIAALVEQGLSNPEMAAKLFLSSRTVGTHVSHILKKLGVHSRTEIAREAALRASVRR